MALCLYSLSLHRSIRLHDATRLFCDCKSAHLSNGILGAAGFIASGAWRGSDDANKESVVDGNIPGEATLVIASLAFQASATAVAISDGRGRIEECNPAFVRITSPSLEYQQYVFNSIPTILPTTRYFLLDGEHMSYTSRCCSTFV